MLSVAHPECEDETSASDALRQRVKVVLDQIEDKTGIILDVSSLPRATYLALLMSILQRLAPNKVPEQSARRPLYANGINFQVLIAEDAKLDGQIRAEDPSNDLVNIPGLFAAWQQRVCRAGLSCRFLCSAKGEWTDFRGSQARSRPR